MFMSEMMYLFLTSYHREILIDFLKYLPRYKICLHAFLSRFSKIHRSVSLENEVSAKNNARLIACCKGLRKLQYVINENLLIGVLTFALFIFKVFL